jgi:hypothetical protein
LVVYYILVYVWFVAKILAANGYPSTSLTDSCQIFSQVWAEDSLAKILASQFLPTFGRARIGHEPNMPYTHASIGKELWLLSFGGSWAALRFGARRQKVFDNGPTQKLAKLYDFWCKSNRVILECFSTGVYYLLYVV